MVVINHFDIQVSNGIMNPAFNMIEVSVLFAYLFLKLNPIYIMIGMKC